ncbi:uncharacterized protein LOC129590276 isoform X2 [Paramacrobiotus metropolitanus]|nr:uncharacterized protein LOC129590276 isoform X2 [Paramacrobiotus metropolitanus]XP_055341402.1 uncharacterized protein LOC129590276 isoform X2 [Paramacrobiotus metropolitanus]
MQEDGKWHMIERTRSQQRLEQKMALRVYNFQRMKDEVGNLNNQMIEALHASEEQAKQLDVQLRCNDEETVKAIHAANIEREHRDRANDAFTKVINENYRIRCENIRMEEDLKLLDRFISVVLTAGINKTASVIDTDDGACAEIPNLTASEIVQRLDLQCRTSKSVCFKVSALRKESRNLQRKMKRDAVTAAELRGRLVTECDRLEEEIEYIADEIDDIRIDNAKYETGTFRREELHKPLSLLRQNIFRVYRRNFDTPEENYGKMVDKMHAAVRKIIAKFSKIPLTVVQKCFQAVDKDRSMESVIVQDGLRRAENDLRMQRFYYKSLDPPEIIWGRPIRTSNDDEVSAQLRNLSGSGTKGNSETNADIRKTSVDIDRTGEWLRHQIHQMTDSEFDIFFAPESSTPLLQELESMESPSAEDITVLPDTDPATAEVTRESRESSGASFISSLAYSTRPERTSIESEQIEVESTAEETTQTSFQKVPSYPELTLAEIEHDERAKQFYSHFEEMMGELFQRKGSSERNHREAADKENAIRDPTTVDTTTGAPVESDGQGKRTRRKSRVSHG